MGQTASIDAVHGRSRANTLKSYSPPLKMYKSPRMSLPEYTLTQYDVKQLMKSYKEALDRGDTHTTSSAESEAEEELMDQIHDQFGPQPRSRSSLQSTKSNASEDSGIDDSTHSPRRSLDDLSSLPVFTKPMVGEDTPMACTPATPMPIPVLFFNQPPDVIPLHNDSELPEPKRRFIPKRLFGKRRKRTDQSERQRSKSVGAVDGSMRSAGLWCFWPIFEVYGFLLN
ncbi:hypothetical protein Q1695_002988 [Nippostrongylus brasiliensis]|nr:hypothetical protein Q1695_002988 [Nippostrongylus brasiliensis]